jgi:hypothetical protein
MPLRIAMKSINLEIHNYPYNHQKTTQGMNRRGSFIAEQRTSCINQIKTCPSSNSSRSITPTNQYDRSTPLINEFLAIFELDRLANDSGCDGRVLFDDFGFSQKSIRRDKKDLLTCY